MMCVSCETFINIITNIDERTEICIIADAQESDTRVAFNGNTTTWEVGDRMTVALYNSNVKYAELEIMSESDITNNGKRAVFRGTVPVGSYNAVTALFPATEINNHCATLDRNAKNNIFMMSQVGNGSNTVLEVSKDAAVELPITFKHMMHKVDFNITYDDEDVFEDISIKISATSGGSPIEFVKSKTFDFYNGELADNTTAEYIMVNSKSTLFSTMLFPVEYTEDVVLTFGIYYDGVKKYEIRKPEEGVLNNFSMEAGMSSTINLEATRPIECSAKCNSSVTAKGVMATVKLSNVAYMVNDEKANIKSLRFEYSPATTNREWVAVNIDGKSLQDGTESITIPTEGGKYLAEDSSYVYRLTFIPEDEKHEVITTEEKSFKTTFADVTAEISAPKVEIVENELNVNVEVVRPYFDGVHIPNYDKLYYCIIYRATGADEWNASLAEYANEGMSLVLPLDDFEKGTKYEFKGAIIAGAKENVLASNGSAYITIPKEQTPTPPAPPVTGDADTTVLAGDWHLTSWRGAEPSFDVYLNISTDGIVSLWQRMTSRRWETYYSCVGYENGIISGEYTDGVAWSTSYIVTIDGDTMTWVDIADSTDVSIYTRCTLPDFTNDPIRYSTSTSTRFL